MIFVRNNLFDINVELIAFEQMVLANLSIRNIVVVIRMLKFANTITYCLRTDVRRQ